MNNILNGTEAFAAMTSGQKIECRFIESDHDFDDIRNFPATVLIDADYEFRIAVVYMKIGSMQVPESIKDAPAKGIQCFVPSVLTEVLSKAFKWKNSDLDLALLPRGLVHLYEANAVTHAQALIAVGCGSLSKSNDVDDLLPWEETTDTPTLENIQNSTSNDVEKKTFESQSNIQIIEQGSVTAVEDPLLEDFNHNHQEHLKEILADVALAKTPVEVNAQIKYTKSWSEEQRKPVIMAMNARLIELSQLNVEVTETPSLMVQIQNAPDLTALDVLEIDVGSRHPDIQKNLMKYVRSRRFELENGINPLEASV